MRTILLVLLMMGGCGDDSMEMPDAGMCAGDCPACAADETCLPGGGDHLGACLKSCTLPSDCPSPLRCTQLFGRADWLCASESIPVRCSSGAFTASCSDLEPDCFDDKTLSQGFDAIQNATCGFVLIACPNGCVPAGTGADGGAIPPHCR